MDTIRQLAATSRKNKKRSLLLRNNSVNASTDYPNTEKKE
jgi:hypothetical protein